MAIVDGQVDGSEQELIKGLSKKYGVSNRQLEKIRKDPDAIEFVMPEDENEKFEELYELVHMMVADKYMEFPEINLCIVFAKRFGYNPENAQELVNDIAKNIKNGSNLSDTRRRVEWMF